MLKTLGVQLRASMPVPCQRRLPEGLPHHYPSLAPTLSNPHYPLLCTNTLASLVKGRWIDGKAQTVVLLHFYLRYIHLFDLSNFSPSRRRDCLITISRLHQPSRTRTIPCFAPTPLPPLSKARCCRPKEFGRLPEGLPHHHPSPRTNPPEPALSLSLFVGE